MHLFFYCSIIYNLNYGDKDKASVYYTIDYDVLCLGDIEVDGKLYQGTSYSCARFVGLLSRR